MMKNCEKQSIFDRYLKTENGDVSSLTVHAFVLYAALCVINNRNFRCLEDTNSRYLRGLRDAVTGH